MENQKKNFIFQAFSLVFRDSFFLVLTLSLALNLLLIYYILLYRVTTFEITFSQNTPLYNWLSIGMTILIAIFFGIAISFLIYQWRQRVETNPGHTGNTFIASFLGAISVGCPVCGAFLASILGIGGGLAAFPFQGLEIKAISLGLLTFAIFSSARAISNKACGLCQPESPENLIDFEKGKLIFNFKKKTLKSLLPAFIGFSLLFLVGYLPTLANKFNFRITFQSSQVSQPQIGVSQIGEQTTTEASELLKQINPPEGYTINASYGDIGPKLLAVGAIDFEKMKALYEKVGVPLSEEQIKILTQGSNEKIKITPDNAYFLLNFLWALGLANKNPILDEGPMMKYGQDQIGNFASTGGWTLGKKDAVELYSKFEIIKLNPEQQRTLEEFAFNSYRPCCSNPTGFPDCNHGMAALALGEIMAANGASADEIFDAFKYFNAFWFPQTYFDIAKYFQAKEGKNWAEVSGRIVAGKDFSTPQGWQRTRQWLAANNLIEQAPSWGGGCGV